MISLLTLSLLGQSCAVRATSYAAPAYAAPTYQAQTYAYQAPAYNYDVVTKFVAVTPYADHAALAGDYFRAEKAGAERLAAEQRTRDQISQLTGAISQLREIVTVQTTTRAAAAQPQQAQYLPTFASPQQPPVPQYAPPLPSKTTPSGQGQGQYQGQGQDTVPPPPSPAPSLGPRQPASVVSATLANRCAGCHTGQTSRGGFLMFDAPNVLANLGPAEFAKMDKEMIEGRMPKNAPLSLAEYGEFREWLSSQSPARPEVMVDRNPF